MILRLDRYEIEKNSTLPWLLRYTIIKSVVFIDLLRNNSILNSYSGYNLTKTNNSAIVGGRP